MDRANLLPKCLLCGETPLMGIMDGVVLRGKFLCSSCEKHILSLEVNSSEYDIVVKKLKSLWDCK